MSNRAVVSAVTSLVCRDQYFGPIHSGVNHNWVPDSIFHSSFTPLLSWSSLLMERTQFRWDYLLPELLVEISTKPFHGDFISLSLPCWLNISSFFFQRKLFLSSCRSRSHYHKAMLPSGFTNLSSTLVLPRLLPQIFRTLLWYTMCTSPQDPDGQTDKTSAAMIVQKNLV